MKKLAVIVAGLILATTISHADTPTEKSMRELMPASARCETSPLEQIFVCRYQTESPQSIALEIAAGADGYYGSLTFSIDDEFGRDFLNMLERFFSEVGVGRRALIDCIHQSLWEATEVPAGHLRLACRHVEVGHRVTQEIIVLSR